MPWYKTFNQVKKYAKKFNKKVGVSLKPKSKIPYKSAIQY